MSDKSTQAGKPYAWILNGRVYYNLDLAQQHWQPVSDMPDNAIVPVYTAPQPSDAQQASRAANPADADWRQRVLQCADDLDGDVDEATVRDELRRVATTPVHAQRQDAQPAAPSAQAATGWLVVKEHAWDHDDSESSTLAYLWPSEFERQVFATFDEACAFMKEEPALPLGWVAMQISLPTTRPAGAAVEAVAHAIRLLEWTIAEHISDAESEAEFNQAIKALEELPQQRSGQDGVDDAKPA